jgi:hypothetical protein
MLFRHLGLSFLWLLRRTVLVPLTGLGLSLVYTQMGPVSGSIVTTAGVRST